MWCRQEAPPNLPFVRRFFMNSPVDLRATLNSGNQVEVLIMKKMMRGAASQIPANSYVCFRAIVPEWAQLSIFACDFYELWNNGKRIAYGPVKSGEPLLYYDRYQLMDSYNVVVVKVHGRHRPPELWCDVSTGPVLWRARPCAMYDADSPDTMVGDVGFLEYCDLDREEQTWFQAEFDDSDWDATLPGSELPDYQLLERPIPPQSEQLRLPVSQRWNNGELLADFGEMVFGRAELIGEKAPAGTLQIEYIEDLEHGWASVENRRAMYADRLTGTRTDVAWKSFSKRGFRYVAITGGLTDCSRLAVWEYGYPIECQGSFSCSDTRLNQLWAISERTLRLCMDDIFNDCPHRDQAQWMDAFVSSKIALSLYGVTDLTRKCILQHALCSFRDGKLLSPSICGWSFMPDYAMVLMRFILWYYQITGDRRLVAEVWDYCVAGIDYLKRYRQSDGLLADVEGAYLDNAFELCRLEKSAAVNSLYFSALNAMAELAELLDRSDESAVYRQEAERVAVASHHCFDLPDGAGLLRDSSARPERPFWNYNFSCEFGGKYRGKVARVEFQVIEEDAREAKLLCGAFGPFRVFCNGELCLEDRREAAWSRPLPAFAPLSGTLPLRAGRNSIVIEVDCNFLNWDLFFDAEGVTWGEGCLTEITPDGVLLTGPIHRAPRWWQPPQLSQATHGYAAFAGLVDGEALRRTLRTHYRRNYVSVRVPLFSEESQDPAELHDWVLPPNTPWTMFFFLHGLFDHGLGEEAMALLRRAWGVMLDRDARNTWEEWNWNSSLCHAWGASPCYFFHREILGVKLDSRIEPELLVRPDLFDLDFAAGRVMLSRNEWVELELKREPGQTLLTLTAHTLQKIRLDSSRLPKPVRISMNLIEPREN